MPEFKIDLISLMVIKIYLHLVAYVQRKHRTEESFQHLIEPSKYFLLFKTLNCIRIVLFNEHVLMIK